LKDIVLYVSDWGNGQLEGREREGTGMEGRCSVRLWLLVLLLREKRRWRGREGYL
jgi:hypothetical protein